MKEKKRSWVVSKALIVLGHTWNNIWVSRIKRTPGGQTSAKILPSFSKTVYLNHFSPDTRVFPSCLGHINHIFPLKPLQGLLPLPRISTVLDCIFTPFRYFSSHITSKGFTGPLYCWSNASSVKHLYLWSLAHIFYSPHLFLIWCYPSL